MEARKVEIGQTFKLVGGTAKYLRIACDRDTISRLESAVTEDICVRSTGTTLSEILCVNLHHSVLTFMQSDAPVEIVK